MKNWYVLYFFIACNTLLFAHIETERTYWQPWTLEHSRIWEELEQQDNTISYFRRNEYFDDIESLILRDRNCIEASRLIYTHLHLTNLLPPLGFAIFNKADDTLIGTIRFKLTDKKGYISFGYGLATSARNQKFGNEIVAKLIELSRMFSNTPLIGLKDGIDKNDFTTEWYMQSAQTQPDFSTLLSYIDSTTTPFKGFVACVDLHNPASLVILMRNGMIPVELECTQYLREHAPHLYRFDIFFMFPPYQEYTHSELTTLLQDLISRDTLRIQKRIDYLKNIFSVPTEWHYMNYTRKEKELFYHEQKTATAIVLSDLNTIKTVSNITLQ